MADAFQVFAKDVVQLLGATSYQGGQFAIEIFNFEKRISEVTPDPSDLLDPLITFHTVTLSDLKSMSQTVTFRCNNVFHLMIEYNYFWNIFTNYILHIQ